MFACPLAPTPGPFQNWNWAMTVCLTGSDSQFRSALNCLPEASVDQFLSAVLRAVEIHPVAMDRFVDLLCQSRHRAVGPRLEHAAKVALVADVASRLIGPDPYIEWASDLAIRSELIRKLLDRRVIRRSILCQYLEHSPGFTNVLALVLRLTPKPTEIGKERMFLEVVAERLAYNSTVRSGSAEAAVFADRFDDITEDDLEESFHSFREAPSVFALCVYAGAVNCFKALLARDQQIRDACIPEIAVRSGNLVIIRTLSMLGIDFRGARRAAVRYHQSDLFDELYGDVGTSDLWWCVQYQNGELIRRHAGAFARYALEDWHAFCVASIRYHFCSALEWLLSLREPVYCSQLLQHAVECQEIACLAALVRAGNVAREAHALVQEIIQCNHKRTLIATRVSLGCRPYVFVHFGAFLERFSIARFWSEVDRYYHSRGGHVPSFVWAGRLVRKGISLARQGIPEYSILHESYT
jgi:hypothetical protein